MPQPEGTGHPMRVTPLPQKEEMSGPGKGTVFIAVASTSDKTV